MYLNLNPLISQLKIHWETTNHQCNLTILLAQAMDLIYNHEIWGNKKNFTGTVDMDDPLMK